MEGLCTGLMIAHLQKKKKRSLVVFNLGQGKFAAGTAALRHQNRTFCSLNPVKSRHTSSESCSTWRLHDYENTVSLKVLNLSLNRKKVCGRRGNVTEVSELKA